jgi:hypothetical protein
MKTGISESASFSKKSSKKLFLIWATGACTPRHCERSEAIHLSIHGTRHGAVATALSTTTHKTNKSFLFLFFKKEALSFKAGAWTSPSPA